MLNNKYKAAYHMLNRHWQNAVMQTSEPSWR